MIKGGLVEGRLVIGDKTIFCSIFLENARDAWVLGLLFTEY